MILGMTMSLGVSWIAIRRLGPAVQRWTKKTLRKPWRPQHRSASFSSSSRPRTGGGTRWLGDGWRAGS